MFRVRFQHFALGIGALLACSQAAEASLIKNAGTASTSNKTVQTTTSGQTTINQKIDPFGTTSFQLDVMFEADKVDFLNIQGINGYVVDSYILNIEGNIGVVQDIQGHYVGSIITFAPPEGVECGAPSVLPPLQEIDIFEINYKDKDITRGKTFSVYASDSNDFLAGIDENFQTVIVRGPFDPQTGLGIQPAYSSVAAVAVPLPPAVLMGLVGGAGLLVRRKFSVSRS